jgi:beta-glucosidase
VTFLLALLIGALVTAVVGGIAMQKLPGRLRHARPDDGEGPFLFPAGFLWGAATADQQIENQQPSDWTAFEMWTRQEGRSGVGPGNIKGITDVSAEVVAKKSDFDRLYAEDLQRAGSMGHNAHRFSISWARLFPREDMLEPDPAGIAFYSRVLDELDKNGLVPFVTLFHFASPAWLWRDLPDGTGLRGIERPDAVDHFERFVEAVVKAFGKRVRFWCTLNEPMVYAYLGYLDGTFPPLERRGKPENVGPVVRALLKMHAAAYATIHRHSDDAAVGIAHHVRAFMPWRGANPLDRVTASMIDKAFVLDFLDAMHTGRLKMTQTNIDEEIPGLRGSFDYVGVNHYGRSYVKTALNKPGTFDILFHDPNEPGEEWSDLGWAADEAALTTALVRFHHRYSKPLYVLENGLADREDDDKRRQRFLVRNAQAVWRAVQKHGVDVRGYFHWSLVDNFEWAEGFAPRFGLYAVDYEKDFARHPRGSVDVYKQIATANSIPGALWRKFTR